jgi:hypothetical protein
MCKIVFGHLLALDLALNAVAWANDQLDKLEDWAYRVGTTVNLDKEA